MSASQSFWEHLDELRGSIIKMLVAVMVFTVAAFCFKTEVFNVLLAPVSDDFITYRGLEAVATWALGNAEIVTNSVEIQLINTGLAHQFLLHVKAAFFIGLLVASPYIVYKLFCFIAPGLYARERHYALRLAVSGYLMFVVGILLAYYLIFPLTFRFLGAYQVSEAVANTVTLSSYLETLLVLSFAMGLVFEIPVLCCILASMGLVKAQMMRHFRRHVVVGLLVLSAIITPTADAFTLMLVATPMWLLYEISILLVSRREK